MATDLRHSRDHNACDDCPLGAAGEHSVELPLQDKHGSTNVLGLCPRAPGVHHRHLRPLVSLVPRGTPPFSTFGIPPGTSGRKQNPKLRA